MMITTDANNLRYLLEIAANDALDTRNTSLARAVLETIAEFERKDISAGVVTLVQSELEYLANR